MVTRSCLPNNYWCLFDEKQNEIISIRNDLIESILIKLWNNAKEEDYQKLYLFFDSSLEAFFSKNEVEHNITILKELILKYRIDCTLVDLLDTIVLKDHHKYVPRIISFK